jgi:hypothetical protein
MKEFYVVAQEDLVSDLPRSSEWPKIIGCSYKDKSFLVLEGKGHCLMGGECQDQWQNNLSGAMYSLH